MITSNGAKAIIAAHRLTEMTKEDRISTIIDIILAPFYLLFFLVLGASGLIVVIGAISLVCLMLGL